MQSRFTERWLHYTVTRDTQVSNAEKPERRSYLWKWILESSEVNIGRQLNRNAMRKNEIVGQLLLNDRSQRLTVTHSTASQSNQLTLLVISKISIRWKRILRVSLKNLVSNSKFSSHYDFKIYDLNAQFQYEFTI